MREQIVLDEPHWEVNAKPVKAQNGEPLTVGQKREIAEIEAEKRSYQMPRVGVATLIAQRERTHGSFAINATCTKGMFKCIEDAWHKSHGDKEMPPALYAGVWLTCLKLSRMTCNPYEDEHYNDVQGYAELMRKAK